MYLLLSHSRKTYIKLQGTFSMINRKKSFKFKNRTLIIHYCKLGEADEARMFEPTFFVVRDCLIHSLHLYLC